MPSVPVLLLDTMSVEPTPTPELLTIIEVARLLRISVAGVRRLQSARQLPFHKIGGSVRFDKRDVIAFLMGQRVEAIDP